MRVAFDSRPTTHPRGLGQYASCLLQALRETAGEQDEVHESHRPRGADLFHTPWIQGAMLHSPCPMVVTLHDLSALKRPSERLRSGGIHLRLRHLAVQRAVHVIVPTEAVAHEAIAELGFERECVTVIPDAPDPAASVAQSSDPVRPASCWEDAARATWRVYRWALAHPHRPCVTAWGRPQGLSARRASHARADA
jgi:Glycosyltransferase Family 4